MTSPANPRALRTVLRAVAGPLLAAALLAVASLVGGCGGNPSCVFAGGCGSGSSGGGGVAANAAVHPEDGQWILDTRPSVTEVFPRGNAVHPTSPIVLVFSESMNEDAVEGAFEILPIGGNVIGTPLANVDQALVADGRVLLLFPASPLTAGAYLVRVGSTTTGTGNPFGGGTVTMATGELPTDLTGQELDHELGEQLGATFTVTSSPSASPRVVTTFPADGATGASDMPELVVVLDQDAALNSVDDGSFRVTVDGDDPDEDPVAEALTVGSTPEPRVLLWRSADATGALERLGSDVEVRLTLSPTGDRILDTDGDELAEVRVAFRTIPFATPLGASLMSEPDDAIGIRNLTVDGDEDLDVLVDLLDARPGDFLDLFCTGTNTNETSPMLVTLRRQVQLSGVAPIQTGSFGPSQADLTVGGNAATPRFADGSVSFAFRLRRGSFVSPLRLLDVDLASAGVQDPFLDTTRPTLTRLGIPSGAVGSGGGGATLVSDVGHLVVTGVADEILESVEVAAVEGARSLGNGVLPSVVGSREDGAFVAAPVALGVFQTDEASFTAIGYDRAFNASNVVTGTYVQRGAIGPTPFAPGQVLSVEVFDAITRAPIPGALVMVHADAGDGVTFPLTSAALTGSLGTIDLATDGTAAGAIVTVDRAGYDLFTFHGVTGTRVSVPLSRTGAGATADVFGQLSATDPAVAALLGGLDRRLDDSRLPFGTLRTYPTDDCVSFFTLLCEYGPVPIRAERLGVQSFFAGDFSATETTFNANQLLQAFCLEVPTGPVASGDDEDTSFELPFLLSDSSVDPEERPDELSGFAVGAASTAGLDLPLDDLDPDTTGRPQVSVETVVPGVPGTVAVGLGLAFDQGGAVWNVRSARPGAVSPTGFFGERGAVDPDLFVRVELRDGDGDGSGVRPRLSTLQAPFLLAAPDVPALTAPAPAPATTGGAAYTLRFGDTIPDAVGQGGLYRARLVGAGGRAWDLWRVDPAGSGEVLVRVPDPSEAGGSGLADGTVSCALEAYAWPTFDPSAFLWSDVEREHDRFARAAPVDFVQGP